MVLLLSCLAAGWLPRLLWDISHSSNPEVLAVAGRLSSAKVLPRPITAGHRAPTQGMLIRHGAIASLASLM